MTCYDENDEKMFDMKDIEQVKDQLPSSVVDKLFDVANGMNSPNMEEVEKN